MCECEHEETDCYLEKETYYDGYRTLEMGSSKLVLYCIKCGKDLEEIDIEKLEDLDGDYLTKLFKKMK